MRYLFNPVVAMFYNTTAKTWHPGVFVESPLPGGDNDIVRHKSLMHHTTGFASHQEAAENIVREFVPQLKEHCGGCEDIRVYVDCVFSWDGNGIPAAVVVGDFCEVDRKASKALLDKIIVTAQAYDDCDDVVI